MFREPSFDEIKDRKIESDREVRQVTHRNYESYMRLFCLPDSYLREAGMVVDVGAGFSSFSEEARGRFPGLRAVAIDPIYRSIKDNPVLSPELFEKQEGVLLDFDGDYRREEVKKDLEEYKKSQKEILRQFAREVYGHPDDYIAASHQEIPLENNSTGLVLASNSIIRSENRPSIIDKALRECLRILKENGEIRVAGRINCFEFDSDGNAELWYNGTLDPGSPQIEEYQQKGFYSDPELMKVLIELEKEGARFYCVILSTERDGNTHYRFNDLIIRKDDDTPVIEPLEPDQFKTEVRKMAFKKTDGFKIPTVAMSQI